MLGAGVVFQDHIRTRSQHSYSRTPAHHPTSLGPLLIKMIGAVDQRFDLISHILSTNVFFVFFLHFCLSLEKWSPALQIRTVLLSIQALLSAPNPDDPLANDVAEQWKKNESHAIETGNDPAPGGGHTVTDGSSH